MAKYSSTIGISLPEIIAHPALADFAPGFIKSNVLSAKFPPPIRSYGAAIQLQCWSESAALNYFETFADKGHAKRAARRAAHYAKRGVKVT